MPESLIQVPSVVCEAASLAESQVLLRNALGLSPGMGSHFLPPFGTADCTFSALSDRMFALKSKVGSDCI
jgi:hypothetical protein